MLIRAGRASGQEFIFTHKELLVGATVVVSMVVEVESTALWSGSN